MAKITLFYGFIYLCKVNNRNHQWQQQFFLQKRTRWEPLFLTISTMLLVVLVHVLLLHLRMLLLISFILELRISSIRLVFQLGDLLVGLVDAAFPMMTEMPSGSLGSDLRFMRRLNRRVFLLDLMDFAVNAGSKGVDVYKRQVSRELFSSLVSLPDDQPAM